MKQLVKEYKNGTKVWREVVACDRCGGAGSSVNWKYSGMTCYKCGGTGLMEITTREYTPDHEAALARQAARKREALLAEQAANIAAAAEREKAEAARREAEAKAEAARKAVSQYVGNVGEKVTAAIVEMNCYTYDTQYGLMRIYVMKDAAGNVYTWKTSSNIGYETEEGTWYTPETFTITGTVKEHSEYRGEKQTVLTRCKVKY